jgi:hypothetical protein
MTVEYRIARRANACMKCGTPFAEGATIVSLVEARGETFSRRDLCEPCFDGADGVFSFWRARRPKTEKERRKLDLDLAGEFLARLVREGDAARAPLAYFLALLLARKRRARLEGTERRAEGELLRVTLRGDESDETVELLVPDLDEASARSVQAELDALFRGEEEAGGAPEA